MAALHHPTQILKTPPHIVIKSSEKGAKLVIKDWQQNFMEVSRQLNNKTYCKHLPNTIQPQIQQKLKDHNSKTTKKKTKQKKNITPDKKILLPSPKNPHQPRTSPSKFFLAD